MIIERDKDALVLILLMEMACEKAVCVTSMTTVIIVLVIAGLC